MSLGPPRPSEHASLFYSKGRPGFLSGLPTPACSALTSSAQLRQTEASDYSAAFLRPNAHEQAEAQLLSLR